MITKFNKSVLTCERHNLSSTRTNFQLLPLIATSKVKTTTASLMPNSFPLLNNTSNLVSRIYLVSRTSVILTLHVSSFMSYFSTPPPSRVQTFEVHTSKSISSCLPPLPNFCQFWYNRVFTRFSFQVHVQPPSRRPEVSSSGTLLTNCPTWVTIPAAMLPPTYLLFSLMHISYLTPQQGGDTTEGDVLRNTAC